MVAATQAVLTDTVTALTEQTAMVVGRACVLVGLPRSTYYRISRGYRHYRPVAVPVPQADRHQPAALSPAERDQIIEVLTRASTTNEGTDDQGIDDGDAVDGVGEDLSVQQVYWRAFDAGLVGCSQRTFYRIAAREHLVGDRRRGGHSRRGRPGRKPPAMAATHPNQLWSWDTTELSGPGRERYKLMLVLDVYSRFPTGWRVEYDEVIPHALALFTTAIQHYGVPAVIHADNGSVMRSHDLVAQLHAQGVVTSYSRPRVSDDNPFSESMFKTIKYDLSCPERFDSLAHARAWTGAYLARYAAEHRHSGLGHYTPAAVYHGTAADDQARRQTHLDTYWADHPARFHRRPTAASITTTGINTHLLSQTG